MKAKTIARLTRTLIAIVVAFLFAVPIIAGANGFQLSSGGQLVGTDSVYELDEMSESDLSANISNAVADKDDNFSISYTSADGSKKIYPLELKGKDDSTRSSLIDAAAADLVADHLAATSATLLDSEGKAVSQQMIMGTKTSMESIIWTGMRLNKSAVNAFCPDVSLCTRSGDELIKVSDIDMIPSDDSFVIKIRIPYFLLATALAENSNLTLAIGLEYNSFFKLDFSLDIPTSMLLGDIEIPKPEPLPGEQGFTIDASGFGLEDLSATVNNVSISVDSMGKLTITTTNGKPLVEELESYRDDQGRLTFYYGEPEPYVMDKDMSDSLIELAKMIMRGE